MDETSPEVQQAIGLLQGRRAAVLTGAGVSTDSGIPAYRGEGARPRTPMTLQMFLDADDASRRRYWLGGHLGWRSFGGAEPNAGHTTLARLEAAGATSGVITQNVDGLHLRAGSARVVELHGTMHRVLCLDCGQVFARDAIADQIDRENPWLDTPDAVELGPDGDVLPESTDGFRVPVCDVCGGMLKPEVVFFGEFVPTTRFAAAESLLAASDALIVAGTSLVVNTGVRLVERARRRGIPIVVINREGTRADPWADAVLRGGSSEALTAIAAGLTGSAAR